nr:hypothetical protein [Propionicimonas sp.]
MRCRRLLCALVLAGLVAWLTPAATANADSESGRQTWALVPATAKGPDGRGVLEYLTAPDAKQRDRVAVRNFGDRPLTVALYAQDAIQTTRNAFELRTPEEPARGVGAWVRLDRAEVTVPAHGDVVVGFTLRVPANAEPGDHAGGIVAVSRAEATANGPAVQYRVGTRVHLRVEGPVAPALDLVLDEATFAGAPNPVAPGALRLGARLTNAGNVRLAPTLRVRAHALFGLWSAVRDVEQDEVLAGGELASSIDVPEVPPLGPLWVTVEVSEVGSRGQDVTAAVSVAEHTLVVWAAPWAPWVAAATLLLGAWLAATVLRRRRKTPPPATSLDDSDNHS